MGNMIKWYVSSDDTTGSIIFDTEEEAREYYKKLTDAGHRKVEIWAGYACGFGPGGYPVIINKEDK